MDFFCYISRSKIDQLYQELSDKEADEWTELKSTKNKIDTGIKADWSIANIIKLFQGNINYGHEGYIQRERKIKLSYVEKLKSVLLYLTKNSFIKSFIDNTEPTHTKSIYFHYEGSFKVKELLNNEIITVCSNVGEYSLELDCSLRFFSESNGDTGGYNIHSGNARFIEGKIALTFETVFMLLGYENRVIFGTPLFFKLSIDENNESGIPISI